MPGTVPYWEEGAMTRTGAEGMQMNEPDEAQDSIRGPQGWRPCLEDQESAFRRLRDLALAFDASEIRPLRSDLRQACWNARAGYEAIAPHLPEVWQLPKVDAASIERLPEIIAGLLFTEHRCIELQTDALRPSARSELDSAVEMLNRFWTLLVSAYEELERVARFLGLGHAVPSIEA